MKPEIKYAIIAFFALTIWLFAQFILGFHTRLLFIGLNSELANLLIISLALWFTLVEKEKYLNTQLSYRKAVRTSFLTGVLIAILTSPVQIIYDYFINPLWVEQFVSFQNKNNPTTWWFFIYNPNPNYSSELLSNTETHLCLHVLFIVAISFSTGFVYSIFQKRN